MNMITSSLYTSQVIKLAVCSLCLLEKACRLGGKLNSAYSVHPSFAKGQKDWPF